MSILLAGVIVVFLLLMLAFVIANGFLIFMAKSKSHLAWDTNRPFNRTAFLIAIGTIGLVVLTMYIPPLARYLGFTPMGWVPLGISIACGCLGGVAYALKHLASRKAVLLRT